MTKVSACMSEKKFLHSVKHFVSRALNRHKMQMDNLFDKFDSDFRFTSHVTLKGDGMS